MLKYMEIAFILLFTIKRKISTTINNNFFFCVKIYIENKLHSSSKTDKRECECEKKFVMELSF